mmetsp:Transcript_9648/g.29283  ORF Transcript_9648/g.29283 Transcript_9648/m.29283 type:complete len:214 (-) Transcript_9648:2015-2656(-)
MSVLCATTQRKVSWAPVREASPLQLPCHSVFVEERPDNVHTAHAVHQLHRVQQHTRNTHRHHTRVRRRSKPVHHNHPVHRVRMVQPLRTHTRHAHHHPALRAIAHLHRPSALQLAPVHLNDVVGAHHQARAAVRRDVEEREPSVLGVAEHVHVAVRCCARSDAVADLEPVHADDGAIVCLYCRAGWEADVAAAGRWLRGRLDPFVGFLILYRL